MFFKGSWLLTFATLFLLLVTCANVLLNSFPVLYGIGLAPESHSSIISNWHFLIETLKSNQENNQIPVVDFEVISTRTTTTTIEGREKTTIVQQIENGKGVSWLKKTYSRPEMH